MKNILTKMLNIMSEVDRIEKDRKNDHGGYKYASEKVIKEVLHFAFVKHGVVFSVSSGNPRIINSIGKDGKEISVCVALDVAYKFQDPDTGECIEGSCVGSGNPRDDKGIYAALTGAIKYILTSNFLIPTGDDPESNFFDRYKDDDATVVVELTTGEAMVTKAESKNPAPIIKPIAVKVADTARQTKDTLLTEKSRNAIAANFDKLGVEIWDLEKKWGAVDTWTMKTRSEMLLVYGKIIDGKINYSAKDFLEGKM